MSEYGPDLFKGSAQYYAKYRPVYPSSLIRFLVEKFSLNGDQHLLDLGCGTGQLTMRFSDWCHQIVAIDQEPEMIEEAKRIHDQLRTGRIEWMEGSLDEYFASRHERFDLVLIAKAFHWMDRPEVLRKLYDRIPEGGGVAIIDTYHLDPSCVPWRSTLNQLIEKWYGKKRRAGNSTYAHPLIRHEQVLTESPFKAEVHTLPPYEVIWTVESILGNLYSTSYGAKRFLGQNVGAFESEVEDALANLSEEGLFTETMNVSVKLGLKEST